MDLPAGVVVSDEPGIDKARFTNELAAHITNAGVRGVLPAPRPVHLAGCGCWRSWMNRCRVLEAAQGTQVDVLVLFALSTELRIGEVFGLKCPDIDFEARRIFV